MCEYNVLKKFYKELEVAINVIYETTNPKERAMATYNAMKNGGIQPTSDLSKYNITCYNCGSKYSFVQKWEKENIVNVVYEIIKLRKDR